jgi:hypothetical protein
MLAAAAARVVRNPTAGASNAFLCRLRRFCTVGTFPLWRHSFNARGACLCLDHLELISDKECSWMSRFSLKGSFLVLSEDSSCIGYIQGFFSFLLNALHESFVTKVLMVIHEVPGHPGSHCGTGWLLMFEFRLWSCTGSSAK